MNDLVRVLGLAQPQVSKHLRVLRAIGAVQVRDQGRQRLYRLDGRALKPIHDGTTSARGPSVAEELAALRAQSGKDVSVGGTGFASTLVELDLIDEYRLFVSPVVLGGGTRYLPALDSRIDLELVETRTFGGRVVYLRYRRG